jgi:hypothetical protein
MRETKTKYTPEEILGLYFELRDQRDTYWALAGLFEDFMNEGLLKDGLSEPGSMNSAMVLERLKIFPDVIYALKMAKEDVPLYIAKGQEKPIAVWRLRIDK